jgi:hypothetical protein
MPMREDENVGVSKKSQRTFGNQGLDVCDYHGISSDAGFDDRVLAWSKRTMYRQVLVSSCTLQYIGGRSRLQKKT